MVGDFAEWTFESEFGRKTPSPANTGWKGRTFAITDRRISENT